MCLTMIYVFCGEISLCILKFPFNEQSCILELLTEHYLYHPLIIMPKTLALIFLFPVYHFAFRSLLPMFLLHGEAPFPSGRKTALNKFNSRDSISICPSNQTACSGFPSRVWGPLGHSHTTSPSPSGNLFLENALFC